MDELIVNGRLNATRIRVVAIWNELVINGWTVNVKWKWRNAWTRQSTWRIEIGNIVVRTKLTTS